MDDSPADLRDAALDAHANAYCPYSNYRVGVAVRTGSGNVYSGCNVENAEEVTADNVLSCVVEVQVGS